MTTEKSLHRIFLIQNYWVNQYQKITLTKNVIFSLTKVKKFFPFKYIKISEELSKKFNDTNKKTLDEKENLDRVFKRIAALEYCLSNDECRWVHTITDDTHIVISTYENFVNEMESNFDPLQDFVIKGNCIENFFFNKKIKYLQGGSGYFISRKGAEILLQNLKLWTEKTIGFDDVFFGILLKKLGYSLELSQSSRFLGTNFHIKDFELLKKQKYGFISNCNIKKLQRSCGSKFFQLNKVAVFHSSPKIFNYPPFEVYLKQPNWIKFYIKNGHPKLCKKEKEEI